MERDSDHTSTSIDISLGDIVEAGTGFGVAGVGAVLSGFAIYEVGANGNSEYGPIIPVGVGVTLFGVGVVLHSIEHFRLRIESESRSASRR